MRFALLILFALSASLADAAMPRWWPASNGRVADEVERLAQTDKRLAEMDQKLVETDREMQKMFGMLKDLRGHHGILDRIVDEEARQAIENIKLADGRLREISDWKKQMDQASGTMMNLIKGIGMGDPTALIALAIPLLGGRRGALWHSPGWQGQEIQTKGPRFREDG